MRVFCAPDASTGPALLGYSSPLAAGWPTLCAVRIGWVRSSSPFHFFSVIPSGAARFFFRAALWRVGLRSRGTVATRNDLAHSLKPQAARRRCSGSPQSPRADLRQLWRSLRQRRSYQSTPAIRPRSPPPRRRSRHPRIRPRSRLAAFRRQAKHGSALLRSLGGRGFSPRANHPQNNSSTNPILRPRPRTGDFNRHERLFPLFSSRLAYPFVYSWVAGCCNGAQSNAKLRP
jgi:hypothetical protein